MPRQKQQRSSSRPIDSLLSLMMMESLTSVARLLFGLFLLEFKQQACSVYLVPVELESAHELCVASLIKQWRRAEQVNYEPDATLWSCGATAGFRAVTKSVNRAKQTTRALCLSPPNELGLRVNFCIVATRISK